MNDLAKSQREWEEERNVLVSKLEEATSNNDYFKSKMADYEAYFYALMEEKNDLLFRVSKAVAPEADLDRVEKLNRRIREELREVTAKLNAETTSCEHPKRDMEEVSEKNKKLEEEKVELTAKLTATELYRSYLIPDVDLFVDLCLCDISFLFLV